MLEKIQKFFNEHIADGLASGPTESPHAYQLATAALLLEMTRADYEVKAVEQDEVAAAISDAFDLTPSETEALLSLAQAEVADATSLYPFTRLVNDNFDAAGKAQVVELLWRVAYADGEIDKYEEHLLRKIADLIHVPHRTYIRAKHRVLDGKN